jgi:hypothetical protein
MGEAVGLPEFPGMPGIGGDDPSDEQ